MTDERVTALAAGAQACTLYTMRRYSVAQARQHLAEVLDSAEAGEDIVIQRRGTSFVVKQLDGGPAKRSHRRAPLFEILDSAVEAGDWCWMQTPQGSLAFVAGAKRKK